MISYFYEKSLFEIIKVVIRRSNRINISARRAQANAKIIVDIKSLTKSITFKKMTPKQIPVRSTRSLTKTAQFE